jgi:hypothetical protein
LCWTYRREDVHFTVSCFIFFKTQFNVGDVGVSMACIHLNQQGGIHNYFIALTRNRDILHTWIDLNVANWDAEEVLPNPIQRDGCVDLYS